MYEYQYYSKKLNKVFDDVKSLKEAEDEFDKENQKKLQAQKEAEKKALELKEQREARAKEIEQAIAARDEAQKKVNELTNAFVRDYGSWHYTFRKTFADGIWNEFFKVL